MSIYVQQFRDNLARVNDLRALHDALNKQTAPVIDLSDLLRACFVMAVSALDHYIHEITRIGMMEIFDGLRVETQAYSKFRLSMQTLVGATTLAGARSNVEADIRTQHSYLAFQRPDKIADAVRLISELKLWDEIGALLSIPSKDLKDQLNLIIDRRNKIAHEADLDPTYPGIRWPIASTDVAGVVSFVSDIVEAIDLLVGPKP